MLSYFMVIAALCLGGEAVKYDRCQLATALVQNGFNRADIAQWVCLVESESGRATSSKGGPNKNGSYDYGLFQINSQYWCDVGAKGCNVKCSDLLNDNISDDSKCAQLIFKRQGFKAWYGWQHKCKGKNVSSYVAGCKF